MTKRQPQEEPTPEDLKKWEELDELGMTAMAGKPFTDEEYNARLATYSSLNYLT